MTTTFAADYTADGVLLGVSNGGTFEKKLQLGAPDRNASADTRRFLFSQWTDATTRADVRIQGIAKPEFFSDAVDLATVLPLHAFFRVTVVATTHVSLTTPPSSIDGVPIGEVFIALLTNQSNAVQNGVYNYDPTAGTFSRHVNYNTSLTNTTGKFFYCVRGDVNARTCWVCVSGGVPGSSPLTFECFSVTAGRINNTNVTITDASIVSSNGSLNFGSCNLTTTGNSTATNYFSNSDRRLKTALRPLALPLSALDYIHGYRFDWRSSGRTDVGFMAQDVRALMPEAVAENEETGLLSVDYSRVVPFLLEWIRAIRDETRVIPDLQRQYELLSQEVQDVRNMVEEREARLTHSLVGSAAVMHPTDQKNVTARL
jgi:hypothetical protein